MKIEELKVPSRCLNRQIPVCAAVPDTPSGQWALLLHGYGGDQREWLNKSAAAELAEKNGLTLIMPGCGDGYYEDTREPMGCFLGEELPNFVRAHFPVSPRREDTFIAGASMGGFGALLIDSRYSRMYGKILSFGGAFIITDVAIGNPGVLGNGDVHYFRRVFGDFSTLEGSLRDPLAHAQQAVEENRMSPVLLLCGSGDVLCRSNEKMHRDLTRLGIRAQLWLVPGGHSWSAWNPHVESALRWLQTPTE